MYTSTYTGEDSAAAQEFQRLSQVLIELAEFVLTETHVEPEKPRDGMFRFADGTDWDPGSGRGLYYYDGGWTFIA